MTTPAFEIPENIRRCLARGDARMPVLMRSGGRFREVLLVHPKESGLTVATRVFGMIRGCDCFQVVLEGWRAGETAEGAGVRAGSVVEFGYPREVCECGLGSDCGLDLGSDSDGNELE